MPICTPDITSFENHEISISRIFVPINFHTARSEAVELVVNVRQMRNGIGGRFQYTLQKTYLYGPITAGFAGDEPLSVGERIVPAFDQTHTGTAQLFYQQSSARFVGRQRTSLLSGTIIEGGNRIPHHLTADLASG